MAALTTARRAGLLFAAAAISVCAASSASAASRTPVVFFPGYGTTILQITAKGQHSVGGCAASGTYQDGIPADPGTTYDQVCRDRLETPRYEGPKRLGPSRRFTFPQGVKVTIPHYGDVASAPIYDNLYSELEAAGYTADVDLRVAGYNWRLSPDLGGFLPRTKRLIVQTYRRNQNRPVRLVGHSNGPMYAQYLLTHVTAKWKRRYIQGFTDIAGNLPGQGILYSYAFTGTEIPQAFGYPATPEEARSSARLMAMSPSTWMSAASPTVFGRSEVVIRDDSTGRSYTPADAIRMLRDAGMPAALPLARRYLGFIAFRGKKNFPNVDVTAERGSGLTTPVGLALPNLTMGQVMDPATATFFNRQGDSNQEDRTNTAVEAWRAMKCHRFRIHDNPGVTHLGLVADPAVIDRLLSDLKRPRKSCPRA